MHISAGRTLTVCVAASADIPGNEVTAFKKLVGEAVDLWNESLQGTRDAEADSGAGLSFDVFRLSESPAFQSVSACKLSVDDVTIVLTGALPFTGCGHDADCDFSLPTRVIINEHFCGATSGCTVNTFPGVF